MTSFCGSAYTSKGFVDFGEKNYAAENFRYILKGHSAAVKTEIFNALKTRLSDMGIPYVLKKDFGGKPVTLVCDEKRFEITDGTYPYAAEPLSYGAFDKITDISAFQNFEEIKKEAQSIAELLLQLKKQEHRTTRFLAAASGVKANTAKNLTAASVCRKRFLTIYRNVISKFLMLARESWL